MNLVKTGKTIARLRKEAGLTQALLAEKLGVSDKAVSKWERGIACPDVSQWSALSILLDTDIESLIYGHDSEKEWNGILFLDPAIPAETTIYNKSLIHYLISQFLLVGITNILIIGNCKPLFLPGIRIEVSEKLNQRFTSNLMVIYGNSFLYGPNLTKHFKRAMSRTEGLTIIASMKHKGSNPLALDQDRKVVYTKNLTANQYFAEPFVFIPNKLDVECPDLFEKVLNTSDLNAETMVRGMMSFSINSFDAAYEMAKYIKLMENMTGEKIGCVEEIMIRRGIADYKETRKYCDKGTKDYLGELFG